MKRYAYSALASGSLLAAAATGARAQETGFFWEGELEIGVESVIHSDDPTAEINDGYPSFSLGAEYRFNRTVAIFGELTAESVIDPAKDRVFEDLGLYVSQLGLRFYFDDTVLSVGKVAPAFGTAWDVAPGFFGTSLAEDYEMTESIGFTLDVPVGDGVVSMALFYADDTRLSESFFTDRGRNSTALGGAGNTGKLNNAAIQWSQSFDTGTTLSIGARHLSAGTGDVSDENAVVVGVEQVITDDLTFFAEGARFNGYGGSGLDAGYGTLGLAYVTGPWTWSVSAAERQIDGTGTDRLYGIGLDYEFENGVTLGGGLARLDESGVKSNLAGVSVIIPLGG